ncbi:MAG TPA: class I SAM-dependent methyltransferase [Candidatus Lachnoclostridium stercoravium]|uniref:Class I SAM-dependent methyltransferase n=1 Tax=Candidatus Lachnoclostridium stercoravium TaxID=2838633 RepID=A0A9D2HHC9_9FIRM|nr:class I SAM-dependent methyltransferase [Candidatus Lachnoclostridium stercoravium]
MEAYSSFAEVYDLFMDNVPYEEWSVYLQQLLKENGVEDGLVLDLGCGTGTLTELLAAQGYDMIGVDASEEMLQAAMEKRTRSGQDILYLLQDMREFELYGTVRAVVSICDSINYILEYEDLVRVFTLVNNYLDPGGVFIFDLNTVYKYQNILGDNTFAEDREESSFIWDNFYDEEDQVNEYDLTLFIREENGLYRKYTETHYQKAYDLTTVRRALKEAGMEFAAAYDAFTKEPPKKDSERIYVIAREKGKERKI